MQNVTAMSNVGLPDRQEPQAAEQIDQRGGMQASDAAGGPAQPPHALQTADPRYRLSQFAASLNLQVTSSSHNASCVGFCQPVLIASSYTAVAAGSQVRSQSVWSS